ncbi:hypothetical protein LXL04_035957 [Taraxacum kok-saghyz]
MMTKQEFNQLSKLSLAVGQTAKNGYKTTNNRQNIVNVKNRVLFHIRTFNAHFHEATLTRIKKFTTPARGTAPWTPPEPAAPDPAVRGCRPRTLAVRNHPDELKQVCTPHHPYLLLRHKHIVNGINPFKVRERRSSLNYFIFGQMPKKLGVSKNRTGNRNRTNNRKNRNRKNRNRDNNRKNRNRKNRTETVTITAKTATAKTEPQPKPQPHRKTETAPQNFRQSPPQVRVGSLRLVAAPGIIANPVGHPFFANPPGHPFFRFTPPGSRKLQRSSAISPFSSQISDFTAKLIDFTAKLIDFSIGDRKFNQLSKLPLTVGQTAKNGYKTTNNRQNIVNVKNRVLFHIRTFNEHFHEATLTRIKKFTTPQPGAPPLGPRRRLPPRTLLLGDAAPEPPQYAIIQTNSNKCALRTIRRIWSHKLILLHLNHNRNKITNIPSTLTFLEDSSDINTLSMESTRSRFGSDDRHLISLNLGKCQKNHQVFTLY